MCKRNIVGLLKSQFGVTSAAVVSVLREVKRTAGEFVYRCVYFHLFSGDSLEAGVPNAGWIKHRT